MKIVNSELVKDVDWSNDQILSQLSLADYFIVVNPELDLSVLDLINIDVPLSDYCIKYKIGDGWIAKRFSKNWNGQIRIVQLPLTPYNITVNKYALANSKVLDYNVPAWDLPYRHVWTYDTAFTNGRDMDAVSVSYIKSASGRKVIGVADINIETVFDVIFISYNETTANANWERLKSICPRAKRVIGVKGIYHAHAAAALISQTEMFYIVDADSFVTDFQFDYAPPIQDREMVHIWFSRNPVNGLEYGYGGIKLFSKLHFQESKSEIIDVATSLGEVKIMPQVVCETRFNTDPFNTWRSAFRECVKLSSMIINNQNTTETEQRLDTWCNTWLNDNIPNWVWTIEGARDGKEYGKEHVGNIEALEKINDFEWLKKKFTDSYD